AGRRGDLLFFIGTHPREPSFGDTQFQKKISFERQSLRQRRLGGVADEPFDVSNRFRRMRRQAPCDLHRAIEDLAADYGYTSHSRAAPISIYAREKYCLRTKTKRLKGHTRQL